MNHAILFITGLDALVVLALWGGLKWSGITWPWPAILAGVVGIQAVIVGGMMIRRHFGWGDSHGFSPAIPAMVGAMIGIIAASRSRSRPSSAISGTKLAAIFAAILGLHITVIGGLIALHHFRHI